VSDVKRFEVFHCGRGYSMTAEQCADSVSLPAHVRNLAGDLCAAQERAAESESELHKWRNGRQLGAMQEDLNAMQARAVEAEARVAELERDRDLALQQVMDVEATIARASSAAEKWYQRSGHSDPQDARRDCADEILTALGERPIPFSPEAQAAVAELKRRRGEPCE
jgi:chromosome segregation ATPase